MTTVATQPGVDEQKVREILDGLTLPAEIKRVEAEFGPDSTGDPAVKLTFHVKDGAVLGPKTIKRLSVYLRGVVTTLLAADIGGFPYTRLL